MANDDYAVVVGINCYPNFAQDAQLEGAENDADAFCNWLETVGAVPHDHIYRICSQNWNPGEPCEPGKPTVAEILKAFKEFLASSQAGNAAMEGRRVGRRLYVFLAGHGFAKRIKSDAGEQHWQPALLLANAETMLPHHLSGRYWATDFYAGGLFDDVILFMDCCLQPFQNIDLQPPPWIKLGEIPNPKGKFLYAFAAKYGLAAFERDYVVAGRNGKHGVFTLALLAGLSGEAWDPTLPLPDGKYAVTGKSLKAYLRNFTKKFFTTEMLDADSTLQTDDKAPECGPDDSLIDGLVLAEVERPIYKVRVHLPADTSGKRLAILDGNLEEMARFRIQNGMLLVESKSDKMGSLGKVSESQNGTLELELFRGLYSITLSDDRREFTFDVPAEHSGGFDVRFSLIE
jgi:hypothetical protein